METVEKEIDLDNQFLEQAVFAIADGYCSINLTRNVIPGVMHQVVNGVNYDLNEQLGMPENSAFSEIVALWAMTVPEEGRKDFLDVLNRESLLERFHKGERHISFQYWTRTATYEPMLAEDHIAMFHDRKTGDVLAVNYVLDRTEQYRLKQYKDQMEQKNHRLEELLEAEKVYNSKLYLDVLTNAYNRRYYEEVVHEFPGPAGVALMDLDDFKIYNYTYGHQAGDLVWEATADAVRSCIRAGDMLIRYGGDEFLLVLVGIPADFFPAKLKQICEKISSTSVPGYARIHLSMSIGGAMQSFSEPMAEVVCRADRLMYQAKRKKNTAMVENQDGTSRIPEGASGKLMPKLLIIDDSQLNRELLAAILGDEYQVLEASNGREGLAKLYENQQEIALVLLDINMPELDGFGVLEELNVNHVMEDIPVIMISSDDSEAVIRKAYELGASDYVNRPFDAQIVYRRVANTVKLYARQRHLVELISRQIRKQEHNVSMMVGVLSQIVEFRNGESGTHVRHIHKFTELLLNHLCELTDRYKLSQEEKEWIPLASAMHDIGKIAVDENILNKPGRLTKEEFEIIKTHSMLGAQMLKRLDIFEEEPLLQVAYEIVRWHHERWDGNGYPDGLKGDAIPISAQIVSLADVYDALTSERCYKKAFSHEKAMQMICDGECGAFNPLLIQCIRDVQETLKEMNL